MRYQPGRRTYWPAIARGMWSLSVTRNRRLTFRIDRAEREIFELNLEDYY